ncbi:hypothetical protein ScPMuIL_012906 [Solemya velum]
MAATIADSPAHVVEKAVETGEEAEENMETVGVEPVQQAEIVDQCPHPATEEGQSLLDNEPVGCQETVEAPTEATVESQETSTLCEAAENEMQTSEEKLGASHLSTEQLTALVEELTTQDVESEVSSSDNLTDIQAEPVEFKSEETEIISDSNGDSNSDVVNNEAELDHIPVEDIQVKDAEHSVPDEQSPEGGCSSSSSGSMNASVESDDLCESVGTKEQAATDVLKSVQKKSEKTAEKKSDGNTGKVSKGEEKKHSKSDDVVPKSSTGKSKKKEDKSIEHILRALSSLQSTEEKLAALCKKYADLHEEHRVVQSSFKQVQRKLTVTSREKDQLQSEHTKAVMAKSKLESLCRELQKHNQMIRQESLQRAREEDEKRKEISAKFQSTIGEIQQQMKENHERNVKLREENAELAGKLKNFIEQYEHREKQVEKVMQHRELEQQLADAKLAQATAISKEMDEKHRQETEILLLQAAEHQKKSKLLDAQLDMYKEKYEEFQTTINRSNEMFQKFKTEMDKMTKRIKKLEKEGASWKSKWEGSNRALLEMVEEKTKYDRERLQLQAKIGKLESLCRAMQAERQGKKALEAAGIEVPTVDSYVLSSVPTEEQIKSPPITEIPHRFFRAKVQTM